MIAPDLQTRLTKWTLNWLLLSERLPNISCCSVVAYLDLLLVFLICMSRGFSWAKKRLVEMTLSGDGLLFLAAQQWRRSNNNLLKRKESGKKIKAERPACFLFNLWAVTTYFSVKTFISLVSPSRLALFFRISRVFFGLELTPPIWYYHLDGVWCRDNIDL